MNKSQRIYLNTGNTQTDKYIQFQLEQEVDSIEFMSLNISTKDAYQDFNSDYGVLVGRVIANGGVGISNAKISIFIPLDDNDAEIGSITSIYPYKTPIDKNDEGKRYNLLPRVSEFEPSTGVFKPKQPFGSFPIKAEIVTNQSFLDVYKKYYKYTALTNDAGDYMIFGVPVGVQTVHLSVDITDIGKYSLNAAAMVTNLGYSPNLFMDNNTKIKPSNDLNDLPNIETQEITVDIIPFWGDKDNFTIGITRQDFRIRSVLNNTFIIFGSAFTDGDEGAMWGSGVFDNQKIDELYVMGGGDDSVKTYNVSIQSKRIGIVKEKIYYYPANIADNDINDADPKVDMVLLDPSQYSRYKRDGDFVFIVNCNRKKIVTDDFGNSIRVDDTSPNGIFTEFSGFMTLEITTESVPMNWSITQDKQTFTPIRTIVKFPQSASAGQGLSPSFGEGGNENNNQAWRKQHYTFSGGSIYSIAKFIPTVFNEQEDNDQANIPGTGFLQYYSKDDKVNIPFNLSPNRDSGGILTNDVPNLVEGNDEYELIPNTKFGDYKLFGGNWLNLCAYLPQFGFVSNGYSYVNKWRSNTNFQEIGTNKLTWFYLDNNQPIAGGDVNTKWFARTDLHWTDFILVPKTDITKMNNVNEKGFLLSRISANPSNNYRNGANVLNVPNQGGRDNGGEFNTQDSKTYFYKGLKSANCIEYVVSLGLV